MNKEELPLMLGLIGLILAMFTIIFTGWSIPMMFMLGFEMAFVLMLMIKNKGDKK